MSQYRQERSNAVKTSEKGNPGRGNTKCDVALHGGLAG